MRRGRRSELARGDGGRRRRGRGNGDCGLREFLRFDGGWRGFRRGDRNGGRAGRCGGRDELLEFGELFFEFVDAGGQIRGTKGIERGLDAAGGGKRDEAENAANENHEAQQKKEKDGKRIHWILLERIQTYFRERHNGTSRWGIGENEMDGSCGRVEAAATHCEEEVRRRRVWGKTIC